MRRIIIGLILALFLVFSVNSDALAQEKSFEIDSNVEYTINEDTTTTVVQNTSIINLVNSVYPSNYSIFLKNTDVFDVFGSDNHLFRETLRLIH